VRRAAGRAGLDPDETMARARAADTQAALARALDGFERDACPGVPAWVVAGERFWGKDRVDWLAERVRQLCA
jgi:2-hydroxychromene-2-carboxylate isomerase